MTAGILKKKDNIPSGAEYGRSTVLYILRVPDVD